jgi:DNA adenine methylase
MIICEKCGKEFPLQENYDTHHKRPCRKIFKLIKSYNKPFLKWVGGKTQIIKDIIDRIPANMNNYHELFLGGGSVLLAVLDLKRKNKITIDGDIYAYDINKILINTYKHIQNNKNILYEYILFYKKEYDDIEGEEINRNPSTLEEAKTSKESYYYWIRKKFNVIDKDIVEAAALFMFLNKTCFRGIYREGPNGFNVPYGHYKTSPNIITKLDLDTISYLIRDVKFICQDFRDSIKEINTGDYVYLDPPYAPINEKSFVGYTKDGFSFKMHKKLFDEIINLDKKEIKFTLSNAKVPMVIESFKDYYCEDIIARRAINSKNPDSKAMEVIIHN